MERERGWGERATHLQRVVVKLHIPHARRGIQRFARLRGVHKALLGRCMRADQGREIVWGEALALEQRDEVIRRVVRVGEEAVWRRARGILAADVGAYPRAFGTGDGGVVVRVLRKVGVPDFELGLHLAEEQAHGLQPVVGGAVDLAKVHHEGAVGAACRRVLIPCACVVEAEADGGARVVVALAVGLFEALSELGRDVPPWMVLEGL